MPKLVEAFGTGNLHSVHVWHDADSLRIGIPSYDAQRGGAFVAFAGARDAQQVMEMARVLAKWAVANGAKELVENGFDWAPGGGE